MSESDEFAELVAECDEDGVRFVITRIGEDGSEVMCGVDMNWPAARELANAMLENGAEYG